MMGAGNFGSPMQLLILLVIVLLIFGGNRLRNLGGDLGGAIKGFKKAMGDGEKEKESDKLKDDAYRVVDGKIEPQKAEVEKDQHKQN